jgi:hypothetical protein
MKRGAIGHRRTEEYDMAHVHTTHEADCNSQGRAYSSALLLLAITSLLIACGGRGGADVAVNYNTPTTSTPTTSNTTALAWDPLVAVTNLSGYRVYYGTAPGTYLQSFRQGLSVGNVTSYTLMGLSSATRYYFAVTAFDTLGNESAYSNEAFKDIP